MHSHTKKRNQTADLLKGLAVILMIQVHLMELFAQPAIYSSWIGKISLFLGGPPAAPIFMVVMGYYFALSKRSLSSNIFRGLKLILLGFVLNLGLNMNLFIKIAEGTIQTSPWPYVFGVDILFLAGLSIIILSLFKKLFKLKLAPYLILLSVIFLLQLFDFQTSTDAYFPYIQAYFFGNEIWWSYFPLIPWLAYPTTGLILFIILSEIKSRNQLYRYLLIISGIFSFVFIGYGVNISANLPAYYHHGWVFYLFTISFLIFYAIIIELVSNQTESKLNKWVAWLGVNVTAAYVVQWLFIGNIATEIYRTQGIIQLVFWFLASIIVTAAGVFLWNKIKLKVKL